MVKRGRFLFLCLVSVFFFFALGASSVFAMTAEEVREMHELAELGLVDAQFFWERCMQKVRFFTIVKPIK